MNFQNDSQFLLQRILVQYILNINFLEIFIRIIKFYAAAQRVHSAPVQSSLVRLEIVEGLGVLLVLS